MLILKYALVHGPVLCCPLPMGWEPLVYWYMLYGVCYRKCIEYRIPCTIWQCVKF